MIKFKENVSNDVVLIGRACIDFNPVDLNMPLEESSTFKKYLGGSPANIAVGLARLQRKVSFIGKVSDDQFGKFIINYFVNEKIDTTNMVFDKEGQSLGLTFTEIKSPTESSILMYRNGIADLNLNSSEVSEDIFKDSKLYVISGSALSASPSREAVLKSIDYAKKHNVKILFDIDYRPYSWKDNDEIAIYYSMIARSSDIIVGSREEFDLMEAIIMPGNQDDSISAKFWMDHGASIVIIKHGKEGSMAYCSDNSIYQVAPYPIDLLKSFGGGDAYGANFINGLLANWPIEKCLAYASGAASMLVSKHSCSDAMPTLEELEDFIAGYPDYQIKKVQ